MGEMRLFKCVPDLSRRLQIKTRRYKNRLEAVAALSDWIHQHKRMPKCNAKRSTERTWYRWFLHLMQRHRKYKPLTPKEVKLLSCVPDLHKRLQGITSPRQDRLTSTAAFAEWIRRHERMPRYQATDETEKRWHAWFLQLPFKHRKRPLTTKEVRLLKGVPGL